MLSKIFLKREGTHRILRSGHPWVFANEIDETLTRGELVDGEAVVLCDSYKKLLGSGIFNSKSQIVFRRYAKGITPLDKDFLRKKITQAIAYRREVLKLGEEIPQRLFWSESDGLPGLIIDRYGDTLVLQTLTLAMAKREEMIVEVLEEELSPKAILERNEAEVRGREGLPLKKSVLRGEYTPPLDLELCGLKIKSDLLGGQKTGLYLDQRENYSKVAELAEGRRVLDCFCNQGFFALSAAKAKAKSVIGIDESSFALDLARKTALENGLEIDFREDDVFDALRSLEQRKQTFGLIILDPPSFARSKHKISQAMKGYHDLHSRAMRLLDRNGFLVTFSCSHHVDSVMWDAMLEKAAGDARSEFRKKELLCQSSDHPIVLHIDESQYLKGSILEKL